MYSPGSRARRSLSFAPGFSTAPVPVQFPLNVRALSSSTPVTWPQHVSPVGPGDGLADSDIDGLMLALSLILSEAEGVLEGEALSLVEGVPLSLAEGVLEGEPLSLILSLALSPDGDALSLVEGVAEGDADSDVEGLALSLVEGVPLSLAEGVLDGEAEALSLALSEVEGVALSLALSLAEGDPLVTPPSPTHMGAGYQTRGWSATAAALADAVRVAPPMRSFRSRTSGQ